MVRREAHGEIRAGGVADHAKTRRIDVEVQGVRADVGERALGVGERRVPLLRAAVLEDERRHALLLEPLRRLNPLMAPGEMRIAAAGADEHRRRGILIRRLDERDRRHGDVGVAHDVIRGRLHRLRPHILVKRGLPLRPDRVSFAHGRRSADKGAAQRHADCYLFHATDYIIKIPHAVSVRR